MKLKIRTVPDPILRQKSKPIDLNSIGEKRLLKLIEKLKRALLEAENPAGVGSSAVQIGQLWRVMAVRKNLKSEPQVLINPKILWQSKKLTNGVPGRKNHLEGCLSLPGYYGLVKRAKKIKLRWQSENGKWQMAKFSGFLATVVQHEMDHLNGILFIDRVLEQGNKIYKAEKDQLIETRL